MKIKRLLSLLLALCCLLSIAPALGEEEPADAYRFSFTARLNDESLSPALREHAQGYADLLDALRFEGTWAASRESTAFDLHLTITPLSPEASSVQLRVHGQENYFFISTPLLGEEQVVLSNDSLLEFCTKGYEHLGVPFQYLALLLPYSWKAGFKMPVRDWNKMLDAADEEGFISPAEVARLARRWKKRLSSNRALGVFIRSLGLDTGYDEAAQALFEAIPTWFRKTVTGKQGIQITRKGNRETWTSGSTDFISAFHGDDHAWLRVTLPETANGFLPSFSFQRTVTQSLQSGQLSARIERTGADDQDLVNLQASMASVPTVWPADCDSLVNLNLTGGLFPNIGIALYLRGSRNGDFHLELRKPTVNAEPGAAMVTVSGNLIPLEEEVLVSPYSQEEFRQSMDLLRCNEHTLGEFVSKVIRPFASGIIRFLFGIPTSSCQVILDDLTDSGVLNLVLGSYD